ncbi:MAG: diacylglycerol kinase family lipid kinase [Acidobacteria bacterium]|nr:diacylglycerol kinase family lipid kinase [Acidobacteriota bacterium]
MKNQPPSGDNVTLPLLIVNPKSASGSTKDRWAEMAADFRVHFGPFQVAFTKSAGDASAIAKRGAEQGRKLIIACGGDGTINEVANGILESGIDVEMGILPSGTGGDFRRSLGISNTERDAARELRNGETKLIDVGRVTFQNFDDEAVSRYFLNVSSFGLSAAIIERVKRTNFFNWIPKSFFRGKTSFAVSTLQEVLDLQFKTVRVRLDDGDEKPLNTVNFCVCNARYFGGGMMIAPDSSLTDGLFDVVNIGDIKTAKILLNAYKLYGGTHLTLPEVKASHARKVEVSAAEEVHIEIDGELPGKLPAVFEIVPKALRIRVPRLVQSA